MRQKSDYARFIRIAMAVFGLLLVYVLQRLDYLGLVTQWIGYSDPSPTVSFAANRVIRLIINDLLCLVLVVEIFEDKRFSRLALWLFLVELFLLLPFYLLIKLGAEGPSEISSPILQQLHRMIVNPLLMIILIAGMYFQKARERRG